MGFVVEGDTYLFAELSPGGDDSGAVAKDVVGVVRAFAAHVAGIGVVRGASWWDVEGFATSHVSGEGVEDERALVGDEVGGDGVDDVLAMLHEVVSWSLMGGIRCGGWW